MLTSGVYAIKNTINGHRYIGSTFDFATRKRAHLGDLRRGTHPNHHLQNAFRKYGETAFHFVVLMHCDPEDLLDAEQAALDCLHHEYNVATDASAPMKGRKHTQEAKAKIAKANTGRDYSRRILPPWSEEHRAKIVAAASRSRSAETRKKMSLAQRGNQKGLGHCHTDATKARLSAAAMGNTRTLGLKHSEETKVRMSEAAKARWLRQRESQCVTS